MDLNTICTTEEGRSKKIRVMLKTTMFDSLPYEILWQILIRVPAQDLFDAAMFVCKNWYGIIKTHAFRYDHLHRSTPGHLVKNLYNSRVFYMTMLQDGNIALSRDIYNFPGYYFWSSCNGLILESAHCCNNDNMPIIIKNPVTKQRVTLPAFFPLTTAESPQHRSAIAYAATSMEYKVIATSYVDAKHPKSGHFCAILTVGVDTSWRLVDTQHLSVTASDIFLWKPFVTEGFVHWAQFDSTSILTMNVETENITQIQIPRPGCHLPRGIVHYYFSVGGRSSSVSVLIALSYFTWEVWEMKPETGEWTKMPGIDLVARKSALNQLFYECDGSFQPNERVLDWKPFPVGWLKYPEVIFFNFCKPRGLHMPSQSGFRAAYNVRTQNIQCFDMVESHEHPYLVHSNSLVRI